MRRVLATTAATVVGLVLLLTFKSGQPPPLVRTKAHAPATPGTPAGSGTRTGRSGHHSSGASTTGATRTATGPAERTPYGDVQVTVTVRGRRLVDVRADRLPDADGTSVSINSQAAPELRLEALQAQSADIQVISGATYTSEGYGESLQAALDRLHV